MSAARLERALADARADPIVADGLDDQDRGSIRPLDRHCARLGVILAAAAPRVRTTPLPATISKLNSKSRVIATGSFQWRTGARQSFAGSGIGV